MFDNTKINAVVLLSLLVSLVALPNCGPGYDGLQSGDLMVENVWNESILVSLWVYSDGKEDMVLQDQWVEAQGSVVEVGAVKLRPGDPFAWEVFITSDSYPEVAVATGSSIAEPGKAMTVWCAYDLSNGDAYVAVRWED